MCRQERFFPDANLFLPERWLPDCPHPAPGWENNLCKLIGCKSTRLIDWWLTFSDPFLVLPFGHGARGCIGRKLAEDSLLMLIIHLFARFRLCRGFLRSLEMLSRLQWNGTKLDCVSKHLKKYFLLNIFYCCPGCSGTAPSWIVCRSWSTDPIQILSFWLRNGTRQTCSDKRCFIATFSIIWRLSENQLPVIQRCLNTTCAIKKKAEWKPASKEVAFRARLSVPFQHQ